MKRKYSFKSFMNNELVTHIQDYGELQLSNKVVEIKLSTYTFTIEKEKVEVFYLEPMKNKFVFDKSRATSIMYKTQYGEIPFEIHTSRLDFNGSSLELEYSLYQYGEKQADYKIILKNL